MYSSTRNSIVLCEHMMHIPFPLVSHIIFGISKQLEQHKPIHKPYMAILKQLELVWSDSEPLSCQMAWLGLIWAWLGS